MKRTEGDSYVGNFQDTEGGQARDWQNQGNTDRQCTA